MKRFKNVNIYKTPAELKNCRSVMFKDVWVNPVKPMPLRVVRKNFYGFKAHPPEFLPTEIGGFLFAILGVIFQKQGNVGESEIREVMFGCKQCGIPEQAVIDGFNQLKKHGYVEFTDQKGYVVLGEATPSVWYKFTPKYLELLLDQPDKGSEIKPQHKVGNAEI